MAKPRKQVSKETFEPKIGFDHCDRELSFSFSELELQGNAPKAESFFSDSEKEVEGGPITPITPITPKTPKSINEDSVSVEQGNLSHGLNHAFFEENSDSASIREPVKIAKEIGKDEGIENEEWTGGMNGKKVKRAESENSEFNEIILSNTEVQIKVEEGEREREMEREKKQKRRKNGGNEKHEPKEMHKASQNGPQAPRDEHVERKKKTCCRCASCYIF